MEFGRCPRVFCEGQPCLPLGTSDIPCNSAVKIYCPKCEDIYFPRCKYQSSILFLSFDIIVFKLLVWQYLFSPWRLLGTDMDGAYIGTTFPHLYLMSYPSSKPAKATEKYVPRVFGFKLHKDSKWSWFVRRDFNILSWLVSVVTSISLCHQTAN